MHVIGVCSSLLRVEQGQERNEEKSNGGERRRFLLVARFLEAVVNWIESGRIEPRDVVDALVSRLKFQLLEGIGRRRGVKTSSNLSLIGRRRRFR